MAFKIIFFLALFFIETLFGIDKAIIILDASSSMWGRINGKPKITIAKNILEKNINDWNTSIRLGLIVYGKNRRRDCDDIEIVIPISQVDKKKFIDEVKKISPKGKTPIGKSIREALNILETNEDDSTIILISDGNETCNADPCETVKEIQKKGVKFVTHIIAFNTDIQTDKNLECITNATKGKYFKVKDEQSFDESFKKILNSNKKNNKSYKFINRNKNV